MGKLGKSWKILSALKHNSFYLSESRYNSKTLEQLYEFTENKPKHQTRIKFHNGRIIEQKHLQFLKHPLNLARF